MALETPLLQQLSGTGESLCYDYSKTSKTLEQNADLGRSGVVLGEVFTSLYMVYDRQV